jgi:hypothetical protein
MHQLRRGDIFARQRIVLHDLANGQLQSMTAADQDEAIKS